MRIALAGAISPVCTGIPRKAFAHGHAQQDVANS
jgi:hypothetical protein